MSKLTDEPVRITNPEKIRADGLYVILDPSSAPGLSRVHAFMPVVSGADLGTALAAPPTAINAVAAAMVHIVCPLYRPVVEVPPEVKNRAVAIGIRPYEPHGYDAGMYESCRSAAYAHARDTIPRWLIASLQAIAISTMVGLAVMLIAALLTLN